MTETDSKDANAERQAWLAVLARASRERLEAALAGVEPVPVPVRVRAPEVGMVMVQGRSGGTGGRFNLGEMTVSRCTVALETGTGDRLTGVGTVAGRDRRHAELVAVFDALCQCPDRGPGLTGGLVRDLAREQAAARTADARKIAATTVEFFTLARETGT